MVVRPLAGIGSVGQSAGLPRWFAAGRLHACCTLQRGNHQRTCQIAERWPIHSHPTWKDEALATLLDAQGDAACRVCAAAHSDASYPASCLSAASRAVRSAQASQIPHMLRNCAMESMHFGAKPRHRCRHSMSHWYLHGKRLPAAALGVFTHRALAVNRRVARHSEASCR